MRRPVVRRLLYLTVLVVLCGKGGQVHADTLTLTGTVRDFHASHPDMEDGLGIDPGIVLPDLGADQKPVDAGQAGNPTTHGQTAFDQWYRDVPGINLSQPLNLTFDSTLTLDPGIFTFSDLSFFPIDGQLFGNEGNAHNYHFTFEPHTHFTYHGGETFTFTGDDDLWIFINGTHGYDLLADDVVAIDMSEPQRPRVVPGFSQLKLWPDTVAALGIDASELELLHPEYEKRARPVAASSTQSTWPLQSIYGLDQGEMHAISSLSLMEAFSEIVGNSYAARFIGKPGLDSSHFHHCIALTEAIPAVKFAPCCSGAQASTHSPSELAVAILQCRTSTWTDGASVMETTDNSAASVGFVCIRISGELLHEALDLLVTHIRDQPYIPEDGMSPIHQIVRFSDIAG